MERLRHMVSGMKWIAAFAALLFWPVAALALDVGPPVDSKAPAVSGTTSEGKPANLSTLSGRKGAVLVFHRSAAWCPFCQAQLMALRNAQGPLAAKGYTLVAISYDSPEVLAQFKARRQIGYVLLSDEGSKVIDAFKLRDPQYPVGHRAYGVPQPAIFVISRAGVVQARLAEEGYRNRPPVPVVIAAVEAAAKR